MEPRTLIVGVALAVTPVAGLAARSDDLQALSRQIEQLKQDYQQRISALEARLKQAEAEAMQAQSRAAQAERTAVEAANSPPPVAPPPAAANAFNPSIGVILDGKARYNSANVSGFRIPGFSLPDEAGAGTDGVSLGESELNFYANVDDKFYGSLTTALSEENGETTASVEEAYLQTLALPAGFGLKAGRFFSNIGYLNPTHTHADDFADRPLPYRVFLNKQFGDDGVQLRWVAPASLLIELSGELLRGASYPAGGASDNGKGMWTASAHLGGDAGLSSSWRAGLSYLSAKAEGRQSGDPAAPDLFTGNSDLWIADFVWKWAPTGNPYRHNLKLQGEYMRRSQTGRFTPAGRAVLPLDAGQDGFYVQGVYQFMPQWRAGLRYAQLDAGNPGPAFAGTSLDTRGRTPRDLSAMLDWSNSEFSRIRLQYNRDESARVPDNQLVLQYIMSLGAHGAHQF